MTREKLRGQAAAKLVEYRGHERFELTATGAAGFTRFRQHDFEDPANRYYEVRPKGSRTGWLETPWDRPRPSALVA